MAIRKKDFQKVVIDVKDLLSKLYGNDTAELRDALNFSLLHLHKYYKKLRHKTKNVPLLDGSISLTSSLSSFTPASPYIPPVDKFDWRWVHLDASKLSASFGHGDKTNLLPEIFYVIKNGDLDTLTEMIEKDGDSVNEVDALGRSTALYCIQGKSDEHMRCLDLLIENNVDLQQEANDGQTCFHIAALTDNEQIIEKLIHQQVSINTEDNEGRYPLHLAAGYSSPSIVKKMLAAGADKNSLDNDEMTPVMWACYFDRYENVEILLNINDDDEMKYEAIDAELQDKDLNGKTILHWSVAKSTSVQCFKLLFSVDYVNITDDAGRNILHTMAEKGTIGALEEYFSICDNQYMESLDHKDRTPLHLACMNGHGEIVDILLSRGASLDLIDKQGLKPFDYTKMKNLNYCMLVILSHQKYRIQTGGDDEKKKVLSAIEANTTNINEKKQSRKTSPKARSIPQPPQRITEEKLFIDNKSLSQSRKSSADTQEFDVRQDEQDFRNFSIDKENLDPNNEVGNQEKLFSNRDNNFKNKIYPPVNNQGEHIQFEDKNSEDSYTENEEMNLNDQLIVLVEHHGSDDELVIDVDGGNFSNDLAYSDKENEEGEDHDLLDAPPFARNGSITTVGVVSEGSMAFNSVSVNPSVSSLVSSDEDEDDQGRSRTSSRSKRSPISEQYDGRKRNTDRKKSLTKQKTITSNLPPAMISPSATNFTSVTAPVPPPSHFYQSSSVTSQSLVIHGSDGNSEKKQKKPKKKNNSKEQKPRSNSSFEQHPPTLPVRLDQSWPPPRSPKDGRSAKDGRNPKDGSDTYGSSGQQLSPQTQKLAPLQAVPRPPSIRYSAD